MAKQNTTMVWLVIGIVAILLLGSGASIPKFDLENFNPFQSGQTTDNLVAVNKVLDFALINEYAGSALTSKTLYVYDSDGETLLETLTTGGDGTISSGFTYPSGKVIYVNYISSNDKMWWKLTVPKMNPSDAESATVNSIGLKAFSIGTYTSDVLYHGSTSIADAGDYNFTDSGETPTFTYRLANTGSDNTGLKDSYDPIYKQSWHVCVYITFSGTDYEKVLVYGFNHDFTLGSTHYVASRLDAYGLTKHKVGNSYKSTGTVEFTFSLDGTGYTGSGATTMQIYVYAYTDPAWTMNHGGNYGTAKVELAEHTVSLIE